MTRNKARKSATRTTQAATGRRYTDAARLNANPAYARASDIARAAHDADLTSAPARITAISDTTFMLTLAGTVLVFTEGDDGRETVLLERLNDEDDLMTFPDLLVTRADKANLTLPGVMDALRARMGWGHWERVAPDTRCARCLDLSRPKHLLPTRDRDAGPKVCPACWLTDSDAYRRDVAAVAVELDRRMQADLAISGGWAGLITLLNIAAASVGTTMNKLIPELLEDESAEFWRRPEDLWLWLPPVASRPGVLPDREVGVCLGAMLRHLDERGITLQGVAAEAGITDVDERVWPAVVSYATAFATLTYREMHQLLSPPVDQTFTRLTFDPDTISTVLAAFPGTTLNAQTVADSLTLSVWVAHKAFDWRALVAGDDTVRGALPSMLDIPEGISR